MNKYIYSICPSDEWPQIKTIMATGIEEAEEKVISKYSEYYDLNDNNWDFIQFRDELNEQRMVVISDLYDIEEL